MSRPLLFLDVDGPLNPWAAQPERRPEGYTTLRVALHPGRPLRVWLNPSHGPSLLALDYDLCWATTWMDAANRWIAPVLGLPELPYVDFGEGLFAERPDGVHWKTAAIVEYAQARPFAWVDDEQSTADETYVAEHHAGAALLHLVDPRIGLREPDFRALEEFAAGVQGPGEPRDQPPPARSPPLPNRSPRS